MKTNKNIKIPMWGVVKDKKTYIYKDKEHTSLFAVISQWSQKDRIITLNNNEYQLLFN